MSSPSPSFNRRDLLKLGAIAGAAAATPLRVFGQADKGAAASAPSITAYLETLARPDGGYAWGDQDLSHLTPTFGVIGCYRLLKQTPPNKDRLVEYVRTHHPRELKKLEQERRIFDWQQVQALAWLDADVSGFRTKIAGLTKPLAYLKQYEQHGYPIFQSELGAVMSHALLGLPTAGIADAFGAYIDERRRPNGSYNNTKATDGGDGHVMNTLWALQALRVLGRDIPQQQEVIAWIKSCQLAGAGLLAGGGFTFAPRPEFGGVDDIVYTRAAVRALKLLGAAPSDRDACIRYVHSLANADGGFGDRPGWASNATATYYALDALDTLGALDSMGGIRRRARQQPMSVPQNLKVYSIQIESHGQGSPADTVELARSLKIDLWGTKNAKPAWLERVRAIAAEQKVPVTFFAANEEYGTWVNVPGLGTYSHTSDLIAPGNTDIGPSLANTGVVSWPEFRERRLDALQRGHGRLIWQFGENEELVRMFLDDSVERGGFAAISTYHFGNPDFMNTEPFLNRWRGRIPFIALQDAHGPEPWWFSDMTSGFRTLFIGAKPTWTEWLNALNRKWVASARRDVWTKGKTWMHTPSDGVRDFLQMREASWRWWDNPEISRPLVSIVAVKPSDELEAGRPESGVNLRVRCAWENTPQGLLKAPLAELVRLSVDDREVTPTLISRKAQNNLLAEHAHHYALTPEAARGKHRVTAVVRELATKKETTRTIEFSG
jgi:hypothetical protein